MWSVFFSQKKQQAYFWHMQFHFLGYHYYSCHRYFSYCSYFLTLQILWHGEAWGLDQGKLPALSVCPRGLCCFLHGLRDGYGETHNIVYDGNP